VPGVEAKPASLLGRPVRLWGETRPAISRATPMPQDSRRLRHVRHGPHAEREAVLTTLAIRYKLLERLKCRG
jgi:hypothetical protein